MKPLCGVAAFTAPLRSNYTQCRPLTGFIQVVDETLDERIVDIVELVFGEIFIDAGFFTRKNAFDRFLF